MKKIVVLLFILCVAGAVFGQNGDIFNMLEGLTNNFPKTEDAARRTMISNGFIQAGGGYINSFEGVSIDSTLHFGLNSINGIEMTFIFKFVNDVHFVNFIREFLAYFSNKYDVSQNGSGDTINYYVFYNKNAPVSLAMTYDTYKYKNDVFVWVSLNN